MVRRQGGKAGPSDKPDDKDNTIILTSTFVDSTPSRSTTNAVRPQRQELKPEKGSQSSALDPAMRDILRRKDG